MYGGCSSTDTGSLIILQCCMGRHIVIIQCARVGQRFGFFSSCELCSAQILADCLLWRNKCTVGNFFDIKKQVIVIPPLSLTFILLGLRC
jgi:hypothetical protein